MLETFTCRVDNQGRIQIPAKLRQAAGIEPGAEVLAFYENGGIAVMTREAALAQIDRIVRARDPGARGVVDEFLRDRRAEAAREEREHAHRPKRSA